MVKIERTPTAPASLAEQSKKQSGSYREPDVIEQLKKDFHGKCYICELGDLTDIQVEHLLPHHNRKINERVFDWNNLFYSCPHCNSIKTAAKYDEKIIDCCAEDPEKYLLHIFADKSVKVQPAMADADEKTVMTADLIQNAFEKRNTGIREVQSAARFRRLADTMNKLYTTLRYFKQDTSSKKYLSALRAMLKREYQFAAFTRHYVRSHLQEYPELKDLVS